MIIRKNINLLFFMILTLSIQSCSQFSVDQVEKVKIIQYCFYNNQKNERLVYDGSSKEVKNFLFELSKAKNIKIKHIIKEALKEGEYRVELYSSNKLIAKYLIFNSKNIYDEINEKYLERKILDFIPNKLNFL